MIEENEKDDNESYSDRDPEVDHDHGAWAILGQAPDRMTADFIVETLRTYDIPAVVDSRSGFLGDTGLTALSSVFSNPTGAYSVMVPVEKTEEALEIAKMVGGEHWEPAKGQRE